MRTSSFLEDGYLVVSDILSDALRRDALEMVDSLDPSNKQVMASNDLFAIRNVCGVIPDLLPLVFTPALRGLVLEYCGNEAFLTKSIYFDKPASSNWFVAYHQDISISVECRQEVDGFTGWTAKRGVIGVIPPPEFLESTLTVRIHFDDTDGTNGALRVLPRSHRHGILNTTTDRSTEMICSVKAGAAMLMRPLLMHASSRSVSHRPRRVLHLEFNNAELPAPLRWAERSPLP